MPAEAAAPKLSLRAEMAAGVCSSPAAAAPCGGVSTGTGPAPSVGSAGAWVLHQPLAETAMLAVVPLAGHPGMHSLLCTGGPQCAPPPQPRPLELLGSSLSFY